MAELTAAELPEKATSAAQKVGYVDEGRPAGELRKQPLIAQEHHG
jgi:hypothetical protein